MSSAIWCLFHLGLKVLMYQRRNLVQPFITNVRDEVPIPLIKLPSNFKYDSYFFCLKILHRGDNLGVLWYALNFVMIRSIFYSDDNFHWIWKSTEIFHLLEGICVGQSNGKHTHVLLLHKVGIQLRQADKTCGRKKKVNSSWHREVIYT